MKFPVAIICFSLLLSGSLQKTAQAEVPGGFWLSDGYGLLIQFEDKGLRVYEITSISCIASRDAKRSDQPGSDGAFIFTSGHEVIKIIPTADPNLLHMHTDGTASDIVLRRTSTLPERCQHMPPNTPQENYAIFWETFAEQYPFFALHKVEWHAVDQKIRPAVDAATKATDLFQMFRQMIEPLQDSHTGLDAFDIKAEFDGWHNDPNHLEETDWEKAGSIIEAKYVRGGLRAFCKKHVQFGTLRSGIGYLRVTAFYDYADVEGYADELQCLQDSLDTVFSGTRKLSGMVIDVRLNHGGDDPLGIEIASRLTEKKYLAYLKVARDNTDLDATLHFTERQACWVVPSTRPGFKGRIVLLVGPDTVSAGETFAMALMGREPSVTLIGLNTQGVFSDVLNRSLPNGWHFDLPNEVYLTASGQAFDLTGVPPDVRVPFFTSPDLQNGRDAALEEAIMLLAN